MPQFGTVGFTLIDIKVAALNRDAWTYGTPVSLEYGQELGFEAATANQELGAYGLTAELLSVVTHYTGTLTQGLIDLAAYAIMIGSSPAESGSPVIRRTLDYDVGGSGLPYFGLIGKLASVNGADMHIGFPMCMLDAVPSFQIRQNEFIMPSSGMKMIAPSTTLRKAARLRSNKTAEAIGSFADFFSGILPT